MPVQLYALKETLITTAQGGLNPHPVFPQWNTMDIYPYQYWGAALRYKEKRPYRITYLENEYLKVACNLDLGGRVWMIYDKLAGRHAINYASGVYSYNGGFGKNYTCGGMEVNYPLAHSPTTRLFREHQTMRHEDGSASILIGEYERKYRTRWSIQYTLRPGRAFLEMTVRLYNRTPFDTRYMYWSNCGIPLNENTEFIFPEKAGSLHGRETTTFSWPMYQGKNLGYWKNCPEPLGLYMLGAEESYFGYYDHGTDFGMAHYADLADLPGKKYWSWGSGFIGNKANLSTHHPDQIPYGEIQAGRVVIQEHMDRVPPETEQCWTEYWFPVRGTGRFNGAGRDAVIKAQILKSGVLDVTVMGTGRFGRARLEIVHDGHVSAQKPLTLCPEKAVHSHVKLNKDISQNNLVVRVVNSDGQILGQARLTTPSPKDSWLEIATPIHEELKETTEEEAFFKGEALARDWYRMETTESYQKALRIDPGSSRAHKELGKIEIQRGLYASAADHLTQALMRDEDSQEIRYFLGLAYELMGDSEKARRMYELACRYDYEARSRVRLAQIEMRESNFHHALRHLERAVAMAGRLTRPQGLLAACLRKLGRIKEAKTVIENARRIDPLDPFLQIQVMRMSSKVKNARQALLDQVNGFEPPILEATMDCGQAGLYEDALFTLATLPKPGPLALFYKAWLEENSGQKPQALKTLKTACMMDPVGRHPWALELIPVFEWAIKALPKNPRPYYYLGNLLMARDRAQDALKCWHKSQALGERCYLVCASMGYYQMKIAKNDVKALEHFQKAHQMSQGDIYVKIEIASLLKSLNRIKELVDFLSQDRDHVSKSPVLAYHLLDGYLRLKQFKQFDDFCAGCDYRENWQLQGPHSLWVNRHLAEAIILSAKRQYQTAIEMLKRGIDIPANLVGGERLPEKNERLFYHIGCCHEKLGQLDDAGAFWEKIVRIENPSTWEPANEYSAWRNRYFQALAHLKLKNREQANIIFDAMEKIAKYTSHLPHEARLDLMNLVTKGRLAPDDQKDPFVDQTIAVATRAEW